MSWNWKVYISFSGGKDSTALLDLVCRVWKASRDFHKDSELYIVFVDTGLEYPEIKQFVDYYAGYLIEKYEIKIVLEKLRPAMSFREVIAKYGYPVVSKNTSGKIYKLRHYNLSEKYRNYLLNGDERGDMGKVPEKWLTLLNAPFEVSDGCCAVMKKAPLNKFANRSKRKAIIGTMADEGKDRQASYLEHGCNAYDTGKPQSRPLSLWTEQDVLEYIDTFNIPLASIYGKIILQSHDKGKSYRYTTGVDRTGCMFCMYGCHLEKEPNRFQRMQGTHPQLWNYCMKDWDEGGLGLNKVLDYINVRYWGEQLELVEGF